MFRSRRPTHDPHIASPQVSTEQAEAFLTPKEAAAYLRVSKSYTDKLRVYGGGPRFLRFGKRKVLYRRSDLDLWAAARCFGSTSEYPASQDQSECISNNWKERLTDTLRDIED